MKYFDLHCDTVSRIYELKTDFFDERLDINAHHLSLFKDYRQCFALFQDDTRKGESAFSYAKNLLGVYKKYILTNKNDNFHPMITLENGNSLGDDIDNIYFWKEQGVRMMSLVWNGENSLGFGALCDDKPLKTFGKAVVKEMEKASVVADVSHLSKRGFYSLLDIAEKPFVASHSNCADVFSAPRNLEKRQIESIIETGGLIGLNFYPAFLGKKKSDVYENLFENIYYVLSLGGEKALSIGSDFDGATMFEKLDKASKVADLYNFLKTKKLSEKVLYNIFYGNAYNFFDENKYLQ